MSTYAGNSFSPTPQPTESEPYDDSFILWISMIVVGSFLIIVLPNACYKVTKKPMKLKRQEEEILEQRYSIKNAAYTPKNDEFATFRFSLVQSAKDLQQPDSPSVRSVFGATGTPPTELDPPVKKETVVNVQTTASSEKEDKASNSSSGQQRSPNGDPVYSDPPEPGEGTVAIERRLSSRRKPTNVGDHDANATLNQKEIDDFESSGSEKDPEGYKRGRNNAASMSLVYVGPGSRAPNEDLEDMWRSRGVGGPLDPSPSPSPVKRGKRILDASARERRRRNSSRLSTVESSVIYLAELEVEEGARQGDSSPAEGGGRGRRRFESGAQGGIDVGTGGVVPREPRDVTPPAKGPPTKTREAKENPEQQVPRENLDIWVAEDKGLAADGPLVSDGESEKSIVPHVVPHVPHVAQDE